MAKRKIRETKAKVRESGGGGGGAVAARRWWTPVEMS